MFLGIDIGTSGVKAVVIDPMGVVVDQGTAALSVQRPHRLWSEQEPAAWWAATSAAVRAIDPAVRRSVRGVGLAGQMHGATLLDAADAPLRPAILWNDGRSAAQCAKLEQAVPALRTITGNIAMPGFTAPKLAWVRDNEPELFARIATVLLPKDYVRLMMTGDKASDLSDSAGTLWLDVARRDWSDVLLDACGLHRGQMPRLHEGSEPTGVLLREVADLWGMDQVPVAAGGGDNAAGAIGIGVVADGDALLSLGTSGVIFVATRAFRPNPDRAVHAFCHALPNLWHQMSVHLSAASCVDWVARLTGTASVAELFARAEATGPAKGAELFLPYLSGERTPHNDADVRGAFLNLDHDTDPGRLAQAVLEGVAFALADGLDALGVELAYLEGGEVGPALGAARLAQLAVDGGEPAAVCVPPPVRQIIAADPLLAEQLAPKRAAFREAYPALNTRTA